MPVNHVCKRDGHMPKPGAQKSTIACALETPAAAYPPPPPRDASEGKGPQRQPQKLLDRRLEEVAEAVGGGDQN